MSLRKKPEKTICIMGNTAKHQEKKPRTHSIEIAQEQAPFDSFPRMNQRKTGRRSKKKNKTGASCG
jgi:hypothetical protein